MSDSILDGLPYPVIMSDDAPARVVGAVAGASSVAIVCDARVGTRRAAIEAAVSASGVNVIGAAELRGGERVKRSRSLEDLWRWLVERRADRHTVLIALGGGTITDLAGFAAATFMRGIAWVAVPTTILGMADAAIGGKTAIDLVDGKNLVGAFWEPRAVIGDLAALDTLPRRERATGMAEIVKAAIIGDPALLDELGRRRSARAAADAMREAIVRAARVKIAIVASDPREAGAREALNLGHTIGHALEHTARRSMPHGHAVSIGLRGEGLLALASGLFSRSEHARVLRALHRLKLPLYDASIDVDAALRAMELDKKRRDGQIRFALPERLGHVATRVALDPAQIRAAVAQCATPPQAEELGE